MGLVNNRSSKIMLVGKALAKNKNSVFIFPSCFSKSIRRARSGYNSRTNRLDSSETAGGRDAREQRRQTQGVFVEAVLWTNRIVSCTVSIHFIASLYQK
jgi:hypothetical protein